MAVNWRLAAPEMAYILDNAQAKVVLIEEEFLEHLDKMELARNPKIVVVGEAGDHLSYAAWIDGVSTQVGGRSQSGFVGFVSNRRFSEVYLEDPFISGAVLGLDNVSWSVPEPASAALLWLALATFAGGACARRRI